MAYGDLTRVKPEGKPLPLDSLYQIITHKYPRLDGLAWVNPRAPEHRAYRFRLYLNDERLSSYDLGLVNINQYNGKIIRSGRSDDLEVGWMEWIYQFHFSLHLGIPGAALTAGLGITMLASILTGVLVYRKFIWKTLTFKIRIWGINWRIISSQLHRMIGVWSLLFNTIIFFTGLWMNLFAFKGDNWKKETQPTPENHKPKVSLDKLYRDAIAELPQLKPTYVYLPTQAGKHFIVRGRLKRQNRLFAEGNRVEVDAETGKVLAATRFKDLSLRDKAGALVFPLHVGNYGGIPIRILYVTVGLTPGILSTTGFLLWRRKKGLRK